jgi:ABC-2 type transport system ATP-binding protein
MIKIAGLVKRYGEIAAVDNVDLEIADGSIFGLLGPNGAGKTTIINVMTGITRKDKGTISIFGLDLEKKSMEIKKEIGVVPQDVAVFEDLSAYDNLMFFGYLYGLRGSLLKVRVQEALDFTGLSDRKKDFPSKYSGGMKRRLNIACAILHHPKLIIMDEPTVGIDPQSRNHILNSVRELNRTGSTIIYTSHYMEEVEEICTGIAIMDKGRVIAKGTNDELKSLIESEDKVDILLSGPDFDLADAVKEINGVKECIFTDNMLQIISKKDAANLSLIIECIQKHQREILNINVKKPTLEGVFLAFTGRTLRD